MKWIDSVVCNYVSVYEYFHMRTPCQVQKLIKTKFVASLTKTRQFLQIIAKPYEILASMHPKQSIVY